MYSSYTVAEIQAVVQKIQAVVLKPRKIMLTKSAGRDCNVAGQASYSVAERCFHSLVSYGVASCLITDKADQISWA